MRALHPPKVSELRGMRFLVYGLARSGTALARYLVAQGALVWAHDDSPAALESAAVRRLVRSGMKIAERPGRANCDWAVVSPGIPDSSPTIAALRRRGVPVADELDLAAHLLGGDTIAVTGTNGKSTTTVLIARMLEAAGNRVFCGGNLAPGKPLSAALGKPRRDWYVVEASSFQLERARWFKPRVGVVLNVTPDHLNRHGSLDRYAECKFRMLDRQDAEDTAVLNRDDRVVRRAAQRGDGWKLWFSLESEVDGAWLRGRDIMFGGSRMAATPDLKLRGRHNLANALAAVAAAAAVGAGAGAIRPALRGFAGLEHRIESVRKLRGVEYVNNSMCTNPEAGAKSLEAFERPVVLIAGGRGKSLPVEPFIAAITRRARWAILTGENRAELAERLDRAGFGAHESAERLGAAVRAAARKARRGDTVLFAPGFASFDQFADFQARGRAFKREVAHLR
ncbi:MAG: UDP-N-acetylmuramoyl-L-alanine--D-glutamate ligase [bacterium]